MSDKIQQINLPKTWGIYRSKKVQTFHHKLSHCSILSLVILFFPATVKGWARGAQDLLAAASDQDRLPASEPVWLRK